MRNRGGKNTETALFDVVYEDGTLSSNRKVPGAALEGPDGEEGARAVLEEQDRKVVAAGGPPRARIKTIKRVRGR